tara:strand:+ start:601 stop:789 length:189 start_codon:yes stop_codon:yes gene_type:complete
MANSIFHVVFTRLEESRIGIQEHLAEGGAKDQETYWRLVGKYDALGAIRNDLKEVEKRYVDD